VPIRPAYPGGSRGDRHRLVGHVLGQASGAWLRGGPQGRGENQAACAVERALHGLAVLQALQWSGDVDESFDRLIGFMDRGLRGWPLQA
jgi:hypothetical protein